MLVALASAAAIAILMPAGPDDGCPSPRQVSEAVNAHLPGMVLPLGRAPGPNVLRLSVTSEAGGPLRVDLSDPDGGALLRRRVEPDTGPRAKPADCAALAETAALIVDRYWHEVGFEVPAPPPAAPKPAPAPPKPPPPPPAPPPQAKPAAPAPPPPAPPPEPAAPPRAAPTSSEPLRPPAWWLAAGVSGEEGDRGPARVAASLAVAIERAFGSHRAGLRLSVGARYPRHPGWNADSKIPIPAGTTTVVEIPVGLDAYLAIPVGLGRLEPGLGADVNVILVTSQAGNATAFRWATVPAADAFLAWTIPVLRDVVIRFVAQGAAGAPDRLTADDAGRLRIFDTPRFRAEVGIQLGVWFY